MHTQYYVKVLVELLFEYCNSSKDNIICFCPLSVQTLILIFQVATKVNEEYTNNCSRDSSVISAIVVNKTKPCNNSKLVSQPIFPVITCSSGHSWSSYLASPCDRRIHRLGPARRICSRRRNSNPRTRRKSPESSSTGLA